MYINTFRAVLAVDKKEQAEVYNIYLRKAAEIYGVTRTRQIYEKAIEILSEAESLDLVVSKEKSAILEIQRGYRKLLTRTHAYGFPVVTSYRYLGVLISSKLTFGEDLVARKEKIV